MANIDNTSMNLTQQQKEWLGEIKNKLASYEKQHCVKVKKNPNFGERVLIHDIDWDGGFSYDFNTKEDFETIMSSI